MQDPAFSNNLSVLNAPGNTNGRVVACLDRSRLSQSVAKYAVVMANALNAPLTLLQVIESGPAGATLTDPLEWDLRRHEAQASIKPIAAKYCESSLSVDSAIVEGHAAEQICLWAGKHEPDLVVLGARGEGRPVDGGLGQTALNVLDRCPGSVLLVPALNDFVGEGDGVSLKRLLIPLDGSSRAESVLPLAIRIAEAAQAELVVAYVIPVPELIEYGPLESHDIELCDSIIRRNERVAGEYLTRLCGRIARSGLRIRTIVLRDGDVRSRLPQLSADEKVDLIILSAHGHSGRTDAPYGSVTAHLITHTKVPLLIVRNHFSAAAQLRSQPRLKANLESINITSLSA